MCGIVGILRKGDRPLPPPSVLRRMLASIQYRGPDESGEYLGRDVQLAAARLAIVDLKGGHQPVYGCDGQVVGVYNGELYNHDELRAELRRSGHAIADTCDTTLVPHLVEAHGEDALAKMRGMFALAVWNERRRELLLARDRLGIKPLFIAETRDFLLFGSEIKAIFASGLVPREIDRDSLDDLFSLSYPCPPRTMFVGVRELRPGHLLTVSPGRDVPAPRRWWRVRFPAMGEHRKVSFRDAAQELRELLLRKTYDHLRADVPVATYLSGGIDSSLISALVKEVTGDPPTTFSIGFDSPEHDERSHAAEMVRFLGAPNHLLVCGSDVANYYPDVIWHMELPLQFPLALPLSLLASAARSQGFPVVLTGEGADEIFGGYDCFRADKMRRLFDHPGLRSLRGPAYRTLYKWLGKLEGAAELMSQNHERSAQVQAEFFGLYPPWFDVWTTFSHNLDREGLLAVGGRKVRAPATAPAGLRALVADDVMDLNPLDASLAFEIESRLASWILPIGDRSSMAASVEARVPFLDHEVVEFVARLEPAFKMRGLAEKALLRESARNMVPPSVLNRTKRPFYTPLKRWFFSDPAPEFVEDLLGDLSLRASALFSPQAVKTLREELSTSSPTTLRHAQLEWNLVLVLGAQILHQQFVQDFDPLRPRSAPSALNA